MDDRSLSSITCDNPLVQEIAKKICFAGNVSCATCITNSLEIIQRVRDFDKAQRQEGRSA